MFWIYSIDKTGVSQENAAFVVDDSLNAIVVVHSEDTSAGIGNEKSELTIYKLKPTDIVPPMQVGDLAWSLTWSVPGAQQMEVMDVEADSDGNFHVAGRFEGVPGVVRFGHTPQGIGDRDWWYSFPDGGAQLGTARDIDLNEEELCLYVTGDSDNPSDSSSEVQLFLAALDRTSGIPTGSSFLDPIDVPIPLLVTGTSGTVVVAKQDPYAFGLPFPHVYVAGQAFTETENPFGLVVHFSAGDCSTVEVDSPAGSDLSFWRVTGGTSITVTLDGPALETEIVRLFDASGRLVDEKRIASGNATVGFASIPPGVYFARATVHSGQTYTGKAVVVR